MFQGIDHGTEAFLRFQAGNLPALDPAMRIIAYVAHPVVLAALVCWAAVRLGEKRMPARTLHLLLPFLVGSIVLLAVAFAVARGRPANAGRYPLLALRLPGFPSLAVFLASVAAVWLLLASGFEGKRGAFGMTRKFVLLCLPLAVMGSQLVLGLQYLTDTVAGLLLGVGVALLAFHHAFASSGVTEPAASVSDSPG